MTINRMICLFQVLLYLGHQKAQVNQKAGEMGIRTDGSGINPSKSTFSSQAIYLLAPAALWVGQKSAEQINNGQRDNQKRNQCTGHTKEKRIAEKKDIQLGTGLIQLFKKCPGFKPGI